MSNNKREAWQRGPVPNIPSLLQPVAHALIQAREELIELVEDFPSDKIWIKPAGVASVAFHLQHLSGVIDRLFTYAKGEALNAEQLSELSAEGLQDNTITVEQLLDRFTRQVDKALEQLTHTNESTLTEERFLGRAKIPTTVIGLLVHAAEHTMRHVGQLSVTVRVLKFSDDHIHYTQGH